MPKQLGSADKSASGIDKSVEMPIGGADKTPTKPIEIVVDIDTPVEDVLKFDSEGARITFDCDRGRFKELDEATLRRLSKFTKTVYFAMKAQNATLEAENPEFAEINKRIKVEQVLGSADDRMRVKFIDPKDAEKFEVRHFRPDNIQKAEDRQWTPIRASEVKTLGSNDGHVSIKAHGQDELIAFKRPKEIRVAADREKLERQRKAEAEARAALKAEISSTGYRALGDSEIAKGGYKDL